MRLQPLKSTEILLRAIKNNPRITIVELSNILKIATRAIEKKSVKLKAKGLIEQVGQGKVGYWKIK